MTHRNARATWQMYTELERPSFKLFKCNTRLKQTMTNCIICRKKFDSFVSPFEIDVLAATIGRQLDKFRNFFFLFFDPNLFDRLEFIHIVKSLTRRLFYVSKDRTPLITLFCMAINKPALLFCFFELHNTSTKHFITQWFL